MLSSLEDVAEKKLLILTITIIVTAKGSKTKFAIQKYVDASLNSAQNH